MKIAYIRPDMGVQANDPSLIREVDRVGTVSYRNSDYQLHREDGPAYECPDGSCEWYLRGKLHREDGPAVEFSEGTRFWFLNGKLHREDGPAVERSNGTRFWYRNGERLSEEEFEARKPRFSLWTSFIDLRR